MRAKSSAPLLQEIGNIYQSAAASRHVDRCLIAPSPELRERIKKEMADHQESARGGVMEYLLKARDATPPGMNDGLIYPGDAFPLGTPVEVVRRAAAERAPLTGIVRVVVILAEFSDKAMTGTKSHFEELFFSTGVLPNGSVREYFSEVTHGIIDIQGQVVGPYTLPMTLNQYANGASGIGSALPNARTMARDAAEAANPDVNYAPYDNDGDGYVDAFIVIHAGPGGEVTGSSGDIWSHKWVLSGGAYNADGTKIYAYLTVPEDARIGVCSHELGHLLFGFPDLYDTDYSSEGVGNWCLMGGGSWNGGGNIPAHPSAWCKANQGWATVQNQTTNATVNIADVKSSHTVYRLWKDGASGSEYFLVENRQKTGYDRELPAGGLLIWHIDESISSNTDENHPKVALEQADAANNLQNGDNRGDAGDPYPGSSANNNFNSTSTPNSKSYAGVDTCVAVNNIGASGPVMTADLKVLCKTKEGKEIWKDFKENRKEIKDFTKEIKERLKELKEFRKEIDKDFRSDKRPEKPEIDKRTGYDKGYTEKMEDKLTDKFADKFTDGGFDWLGGGGGGGGFGDMESRLAALEARLAALQPFIDASMRPDLRQGALAQEEDLPKISGKMQKNAAAAKRSFDTKPVER